MSLVLKKKKTSQGSDNNRQELLQENSIRILRNLKTILILNMKLWLDHSIIKRTNPLKYLKIGHKIKF